MHMQKFLNSHIYKLKQEHRFVLTKRSYFPRSVFADLKPLHRPLSGCLHEN